MTTAEYKVTRKAKDQMGDFALFVVVTGAAMMIAAAAAIGGAVVAFGVSGFCLFVFGLVIGTINDLAAETKTED